MASGSEYLAERQVHPRLMVFITEKTVPALTHILAAACEDDSPERTSAGEMRQANPFDIMREPGLYQRSL